MGGPLLIVMLTWEKFLEHTCNEMPLFISNLYFLVMVDNTFNRIQYHLLHYVVCMCAHYARLHVMLVRNPINFLVFCLLC